MLNNNNGFTLIETVMFIVIVGVAVAGVTIQFSQTVAHSADPLLRQKTIALANGIMDEIVRKRWDENTPIGGGCVVTIAATNVCAVPGAPSVSTAWSDPTPTWANDNGGEARAQYDDIDDYDAITAQSPPQDPTGANITDYAGYTLDITVSYPASNWNNIDKADVKQIELSLTNPIGESITYTTYRINF